MRDRKGGQQEKERCSKDKGKSSFLVPDRVSGGCAGAAPKGLPVPHSELVFPTPRSEVTPVARNWPWWQFLPLRTQWMRQHRPTQPLPLESHLQHRLPVLHLLPSCGRHRPYPSSQPPHFLQKLVQEPLPRKALSTRDLGLGLFISDPGPSGFSRDPGHPN